MFIKMFSAKQFWSILANVYILINKNVYQNPILG